MALLEASGLRCFLGGHRAVDCVDLSVSHGRIVGLLGPNGAGKTTTLRMLLGHVRPAAGQVLLFGSPVSPGCDQLARVGAMVQGPAFYPWLSGQRNLEVGLACRGVRRKERQVRASKALEDVGLVEASSRRYGGYSSGMARRLGIAAALAHEPELLILDEPTAGLDPLAMVDLRKLLRTLAHERDVGILISSHLLGDVEAVAHDLVLLRAGRVERAGPANELLGGAAERYVLELASDAESDATRARELARLVAGVRVCAEVPGLVVEAGPQARSQLVRALVEHDLAPIRVERLRLTLEEFFLAASHGTPVVEVVG